VVKVVEPEWLTKNVTIDRVRNRIEKILESAKTRGFRTGDNPAQVEGPFGKPATEEKAG
jgi:hypothetical protein